MAIGRSRMAAMAASISLTRAFDVSVSSRKFLPGALRLLLVGQAPQHRIRRFGVHSLMWIATWSICPPARLNKYSPEASDRAMVAPADELDGRVALPHGAGEIDSGGDSLVW